MGIDIQFEHFSKVETFSLDELDNHFVKLDHFEMDEVPDVPLLDQREVTLNHLEARSNNHGSRYHVEMAFDIS